MKIPTTGDILSFEQLKSLPGLEHRKFIEVKQKLDPYALCKCGSGKKYKFCCWVRPLKTHEIKKQAYELRKLNQT